MKQTLLLVALLIWVAGCGSPTLRSYNGVPGVTTWNADYTVKTTMAGRVLLEKLVYRPDGSLSSSERRKKRSFSLTDARDKFFLGPLDHRSKLGRDYYIEHKMYDKNGRVVAEKKARGGWVYHYRATGKGPIIFDKGVEKMIRKKLRKPTEELTKEVLEGVRFLGFDDTNLSVAGLKELAKLPRLSSLSLSFTQITDEGLKEVGKLTQLYQLDLYNCPQITDAGLKEVAKLKQLNRLTLSSTNITDVGLKEVAKLNLFELRLSGTQITDAGLKELSKLTGLSALFLGRTQITDVGLKELAKLPRLESLTLSGTQITDAGLKELAKFKALDHLNMLGTPKVTAAGRAGLKKALPNCYIGGP